MLSDNTWISNNSTSTVDAYNAKYKRSYTRESAREALGQ